MEVLPLPTWIYTPSTQITIESSSPDPSPYAMVSRTFRSLLYNMRGALLKKLADTDFLNIFLDDGVPRYDAVGLTETHDLSEHFDFPGYEVFAQPRRFGRKKGGVVLLLSSSFHQYFRRRIKDTPPETVAVVVNIDGNDVVLVVSYITRLSWEMHKFHRNKLGGS